MADRRNTSKTQPPLVNVDPSDGVRVEQHPAAMTQPPPVIVDPSDSVRAEQHPAAMTQPPPVIVDPSDSVRAEQHPAAIMPGFLRCVIRNYLKKIFLNTNKKQ